MSCRRRERRKMWKHSVVIVCVCVCPQVSCEAAEKDEQDTAAA